MTDASVTAALRDGVVEIAQRAGDAIMTVYQGDFAVSAKSDASPLTQADLRAHEIILAGLHSLAPQWPVLSEESAEVPYVERSQWPIYWLVDPLDGTKEFVARNGEFTVNIALVHHHAPVLGVVHVPPTQTTFMGAANLGAQKTIGLGETLSIRTQSRAQDPVRVVGSRSHRGSLLDAFLAKLGPHQLISLGSAVKFCLIAEGRADLYPRLGPTSEWDTAAAQAVVEAAGGVVCTLDGRRLLYNTKPDLLNPHFLVYADRSRNWLAYAKS